MPFNHEQQKIAYQKLPEKVRDFIISNETTDTIAEIIARLTLSEEIADQADTQILYALMGLQSLDLATENISKLAGRPLGDLIEFKEELKSKIFNPLETLTGVPGKNQNNNESLSEKDLIFQQAAERNKLKESILAGAMPPKPEIAETPEPTPARQELIESIEHPQPAPERTLGGAKPDELKLEPPKPGESATSLAPQTPMPASAEPKKSTNLIGDKLANVVAPQVKNSSYPGGLDPYREPIE